MATRSMSCCNSSCFVINLPNIRPESAAAQHLIDQRQAALEQTKENIRRLEATVPMEAERAEAYQEIARA